MDPLDTVPGLRELRAETSGDPQIAIGLVEGPPDLSHPCFAGADLTVLEPSWLPDGEVHESLGRHATFVASVLFGQSGSMVEGLAPRCRGIVLPAFRDEFSLLDPINAARAIETLAEAGATIIHFAAGLPTISDDTDGLVKRAVAQAARDGVLIVNPTGNDYGRNRTAPAMLPEVLAVGAIDHDGTMFRFSNWGPGYAEHGVVAPGGDLTAAAPGARTAVHKGTSIAAPIVTGTAALLTSLRLLRGMTPDPLAVRDAIVASAAPCAPEQAFGEPERCLAGRLNVAGARKLAVRSTVDRVGLSADVPQRLIYALGSLGYDFGTEARRDSFARAMRPANPHDVLGMVGYLTEHPSEARRLTWTLHLEQAPIYALAPADAFAADIYGLLVRLLGANVERVAVPGRLTGDTTRLRSGQVVPVVRLDQRRGLAGWNATWMREAGAPTEFLARVYHDLRNLGANPADRALNYAATNAFQATEAVQAALAQGLALDTIGVQRSPFCRQDSDCWDVKLRFFDPENSRRARRVHRFTIDVSDALPVSLGPVRSWSETQPQKGNQE